MPDTSPWESKLLFSREEIKIGEYKFPLILCESMPKDLILIVDQKLIDDLGLRDAVEETMRRQAA